MQGVVLKNQEFVYIRISCGCHRAFTYIRISCGCHRAFINKFVREPIDSSSVSWFVNDSSTKNARGAGIAKARGSQRGIAKAHRTLDDQMSATDNT